MWPAFSERHTSGKLGKDLGVWPGGVTKQEGPALWLGWSGGETGVGWSEQLPRGGVSLNLPGVFHTARDAWKWKRVGWPCMWGHGGACPSLVDTRFTLTEST